MAARSVLDTHLNKHLPANEEKSVMGEPFYDVVYLAAQKLQGRLHLLPPPLRVLLSAAHPLSAAAKTTLWFFLKTKVVAFL